MKRSFLLYIALYIIFLGLYSCEDYLEKPLLGNQITQETVFSDRLSAEAFLYQAYRMVLPYGFPYTDRKYFYEESRTMEESMILALEGNYNSVSNVGNNVNLTGFIPSKHRHLNDMFLVNYIAIRHAYILIENIDRVPDMTTEEKELLKAECKAMIALRYMVMMKHYGGVPIVRQVLTGTTPGLEDITRGTIEETVNFILEMSDEAMEYLPDEWPSQWTGRMTRGIALAIKAEALLFAASPLFNNDATFLPYEHKELISYPAYDRERWRLAAEANREVIEWAHANGHKIIDTDNPFDDFGRAVSEHDNQEILLSYKGRYDSQDAEDIGFEKYYLPWIWERFVGFHVLYNVLPYFHKEDGTEQNWPQPGDPAQPYSEFLEKMNQMEPRFKQTVWAFGTRPWNNPEHERFRWNYDAYSGNPADWKTGIGRMVKFLYNYKGEEMKEWIIYRTAEFYLNYAEALNEYDFGANKIEALEYLNLIRDRAGLPVIEASDERVSTQEGLRQMIRRERYCELFGEEHRPFDIRRWLIANEPGQVGGPAYFFAFTRNAAKDGYIDYKVSKYEERFWADRMFLTPFPEAEAGGESVMFQNEVAKGYIIQNPGY